MPTPLALVDLFRPYMALGDTTPWHNILSIIYVESFETASGPSGIVIRGTARFSDTSGQAFFDPSTGTLGATGQTSTSHPRTQPDRSEPWLDVTDTRIEFNLTAPRVAGTHINQGVTLANAAPAAAGFGPSGAVLGALDGGSVAAPPSDYPNSTFVLDLVLSGIEIRPPFLKPAQMRPDGLLVPLEGRSDVVFNLPKIKVRLSQTTQAAPPGDTLLDVSLVSAGVSGLDDPGDTSAAELVTMDPPYAFIGENRVVGFAFRSAILDLSNDYTPPKVLDQFGFDESWTGLYLPEIRLFFAPNGAEDFAVNVGAENLLIGLGDSSGITGDFDLAVINQGSGELTLNARFFGSTGQAVAIRRSSTDTATVLVPAQSRMTIDVHGGRAPYTISSTIDGGSASAQMARDISIPSATPVVINISVTDSSSPPKPATLTITASRRQDRQTQPAPGAPPQPEAARIETTGISRGAQSVPDPGLRLTADDGSKVRVSLELSSGNPLTQWTVNGGPPQVGVDVEIPLAGGETKQVAAKLPDDIINELTGYFRFDKPPNVGTALVAAHGTTPGNIAETPAVDPSASASWTPPGRDFLTAWGYVVNQINPRDVTITGYASYEQKPTKARYNYHLSRRRAAALRALLGTTAGPVFSGPDKPDPLLASDPVPMAWNTDWKTHFNPRNTWWKARVTGFNVNFPGTLTQGNVMRDLPDPPPPPPPEIDPEPGNADPPDWFRSARLKVRIVRDQFVALELSGEIDFETAVEGTLRNTPHNAPSLRGVGTNPADGITDFLFLYQTDPISQTDEVKLYIGADPADKDGLLMTGQMAGQTLQAPDMGRNILGMTTVFMPLLSAAAPANPADGDLVPLAGAAAAVGLASGLSAAGLFNVERVILFGGEGKFLRRGDLWETSFLFDVETAISANIKLGSFRLLEIPRTSPLAVRYKAIGLKFGFPPGSGGAFELRPVFDSSKGYSIDISGPGAVRVPDPLGEIIQVLGARIARTNPMTFEIDLGFALDLGVITIERARVRLPVDPIGLPELTAFGASLKVPGTIEGKGYMEISNDPGFKIKGGIDISLIPVKLRVAAQIAVEEITPEQGGPATGVAISMELELPVAIPLGASGFGIYGFLGIFAMHFKRDEEGITSLTPALEWLKNRADGNPANLQAWKAEKDKFAFGVGVTMGTMGSPIIFNVKGMFMLELPGPRILLVVKANLLTKVPALEDKTAEGTFLCVIDLDIGRGTLSIGLSIDFSIKPLVEIKIPIEAFFNLEEPSFWHIYLGSFPGENPPGTPLPGPIRIKILEVVDGSGYVMLSGHGIPKYEPGAGIPALPAVEGVSLATGLECTLVWGNTSINLYLRITAGFNAVLSFQPFFVGGVLYIKGELKLFIISLSASAVISVQLGELPDGTEVSRLDGEVCGELDLFFFSIKGCVDFHIGEENEITPPAPKLITGAPLVSRTPALVQGTGTDRGIDGKIGDAVESDTQPNASELPVVPIDAIPVLSMAMGPVDDTLQFFGNPVGGAPGAPTGGFHKRGDYAFRYDLTKVTLETSDGDPPITPGSAPATWWTEKDPSDANIGAHLGLMTWVPNPTPKALERSEFLEELVDERWGTICTPAAPATPVFWAFHDQRLGPSARGWDLNGIPWPDPPDTKRSAEPELSLHLFETWRTGDRHLDRKRGIIPATIQGGKVPCAPDDFVNPDRDEPVAGGDGVFVTPTGPAAALSPVLADTALLRDFLVNDVPDISAAPVPLRTAPIARSAVNLRAAPTDGSLRPSLARRTASNGLNTLANFNRLKIESLNVVEGFSATRGSTVIDDVPKRAVQLADAVEMLRRDEPVSRAALSSAFANLGTPAQQNGLPDNFGDGPLCDGRLLASPLWDIGQPVVLGDLSQAESVAKELALLGHQHGPLSDVIAIDSGAIVEGRILLWVNRAILNSESSRNRGMMLHFLDDTGAILGKRPVRVSDRVDVIGLPSRWLDSNGPWFEHVFHAVVFGGLTLRNRVAVLVDFKPPEGTVRIHVGVQHTNSPEKAEQSGRPYYIGALEMQQTSEVMREDWDTTTTERNRSVVETFLSKESGDVALLKKDTIYKITTHADVKARAPGQADADATPQSPPQTRTFWFRTDANAPKRLDPWVLASLPAPEESHVFGHEDLRIAFATNDVDKLYAEYGKELRARLKAASFRQVDEPGVQHPLPITPATLDNVKAHVLSPFEAVLVDVIESKGPCINVDEDRVRHSVLNIPIPLDPYTDYVLDVESVDIGAPADAVGDRVLRRQFSTGAFGTLDEFVVEFQGLSVEHRAVDPGVLQAIGTTAPLKDRPAEGPEFDQALIDAGLEPMEVPDRPRAIVFWEQAGPGDTPAPAAILLDASEPMQRARPLPMEVMSDDDVPVRRWQQVDQTWMDVVAKGPNAALVDKILFAPGKQRALITLTPAAVGADLVLHLERAALDIPYLDPSVNGPVSYEIFAETFDRAPWEED